MSNQIKPSERTQNLRAKVIERINELSKAILEDERKLSFTERKIAIAMGQFFAMQRDNALRQAIAFVAEHEPLAESKELTQLMTTMGMDKAKRIFAGAVKLISTQIDDVNLTVATDNWLESLAKDQTNARG